MTHRQRTSSTRRLADCHRVGRRTTWLTSNATALFAVPVIALFAPAHLATAAEPVRMSPALAAQLGRVECGIVGGRIRLTSRQVGGQMSSATRGGGRVQEGLSIDLSSQYPQVDYFLVNRDVRLRMTVTAGQDISISRQPGNNQPGSSVEFRQNPEGGIEFTWRTESSSGTRVAPTLWHLWLAEPKRCEAELMPLLRLIRPEWDLAKQAPAVETAIVSASRQTWSDRWPRWNDLVARLGDDQFSARRAADRALRGAGLPLIPFLQGLDVAQLEPEQRQRVRAILASLTRFEDEDTPDRVAIWLAGDPRIWLALMSRDDVGLRRLAAAELSEVLGRPIAFDVDAEPSQRAEQIARIETELRGTRQAPLKSAKSP